MAEQAAIHRYTVKCLFGIGSIPDLGVYAYSVSRDQDVRQHVWDIKIWFDGAAGALQKLSQPNSEHAGDTVSNWLWVLHFTHVYALRSYRIFVCALGLWIVMLSVIGVSI